MEHESTIKHTSVITSLHYLEVEVFKQKILEVTFTLHKTVYPHYYNRENTKTVINSELPVYCCLYVFSVMVLVIITTDC